MASDKEKVRLEARKRRRDLVTAFSGAAGRFAKQAPALSALIAPGSVVAGYWPLGNEADPRALMGALEQDGFQLALPAVDGPETPLVFRRYRMGEPLVEGAFRVLEPLGEAPPVRPDAIIVPLLAFDEAGYRLGYGGGYYDRTLAILRREGAVMVVGLAFAGQMVDHLPREDHDEPLDAVITESDIIRFERSSQQRQSRQ